MTTWPSIPPADTATGRDASPAPALPPADWRELLFYIFRLRRRLRVHGLSMRPGLQPGDELLLDPRAYRTRQPALGDIVLVPHPHGGPDLLKRVAHVSTDGVFLLGDNAGHSTDSRELGTFALEAVLGRATCLYRTASAQEATLGRV